MSQPKAFTLIELLIVIAILALLMAILIPALQKSKKMTRRVVCASRLRQIATALQGYANENNDAIFLSNEMVGMTVHGAEELWTAALCPYFGEQFTQNVLKEPPEVFFCPNDEDPFPLGYKHYPHKIEFTSYMLNGFYSKAESSPTGKEIRLGPAGGYKMTQISRAIECMLVGESSYAGRVYDADSNQTQTMGLPPEGHHRRTSGFYHIEAMNIIYVDGHVDQVKGIDCQENSSFIPDTYTSGEYMFWPTLRLPTADEKPEFWGPGY